MIAAASSAGADLQKLQTLHSSQLTHRTRFDDGLIEGGLTKVIKRPYDAEYSDCQPRHLRFRRRIFFECCKIPI